MALNLNTYKSIQCNIFVEIVLTIGTLRISDRLTSTEIEGNSYIAAGNLIGVTNTVSDISNPGSEITITLAGIPNSALTDVLNIRLKGSRVRIWRAFFDPETDTLLEISGNPSGRFTGIVTNYAINEEYDINGRTASNTITLICSTIVSILANTTKGRRTNPVDQKKFYPSDISMDRVPNLASAYFDFGKKS
jgi:hypothetical protein